jgi:hypothetical protein
MRPGSRQLGVHSAEAAGGSFATVAAWSRGTQAGRGRPCPTKHTKHTNLQWTPLNATGDKRCSDAKKFACALIRHRVPWAVLAVGNTYPMAALCGCQLRRKIAKRSVVIVALQGDGPRMCLIAQGRASRRSRKAPPWVARPARPARCERALHPRRDQPRHRR